MKICKECNDNKELSEFKKDNRRADVILIPVRLVCV